MIVYIYTFLLQFHDALCVMRSGDVCCLCDVLQKYERKVSAELSVSSLFCREQKAPVPLLRARESEHAVFDSISVFLLQFYALCVMRSGDVCCLMRCASYVFGKYSQN